MGAFVFAAQMINFAIPGTGSSGHIGGGMLLAVLLGPYAGFLTMASVLLIQALLFADGGLLAFGCNLINMGFFTCFIAYPFIYKKITKKGLTPKRIFAATFISVIVGLQLGAFSVVLETLLSGRTELPFRTFLIFMQPIHLAIGIIEGVIMASIVSFVWKARSEILENVSSGNTLTGVPVKKIVIGFMLAAVIIGGFVSWFAAGNPDGLEWSISKVAGTAELGGEGHIQQGLDEIQNKTALFPGYSLKESASEGKDSTTDALIAKAATSASGLVGGAVTLALAVLLGFAAFLYRKRSKNRKGTKNEFSQRW
jgi:cobalt/nickel transport system permease protein